MPRTKTVQLTTIIGASDGCSEASADGCKDNWFDGREVTDGVKDGRADKVSVGADD